MKNFKVQFKQNDGVPRFSGGQLDPMELLNVFCRKLGDRMVEGSKEWLKASYKFGNDLYEGFEELKQAENPVAVIDQIINNFDDEEIKDFHNSLIEFKSGEVIVKKRTGTVAQSIDIDDSGIVVQELE